MKIKDIVLKSDAALAPMAGFTDAGFRAVAAQYGAAMTVTEMVSAKGLVYGSEKTKQLLATTDNEKLVAVQIFGSQPDIIAKAVRHEALEKFPIIDINMGCPMPKIVNNGEGSALLLDIPRAKEVCLAAVENCNKPITIKFRKGFSIDQNIAAEFAYAMEQSGASALTVHGRTREQYYSGEADYEAIKQAVCAVKIPVFANGDVRSVADYNAVKNATKASGVMIGRGALGNPYLFSEIAGGKALSDIEKAAHDIDNIKKQSEIMLKIYNERKVLNELKKHICYYIGSRHGAKAVKREVCTADTLTQMLDIAQNFLTAFSQGCLIGEKNA